MRRIKRFTALLLAVVTALGAIALSACSGKGIKGEMTISRASAVLPTGDTLALSATFTPDDPSADVSGVTIKWSSSKKSVATVDENGVVTAVGAGNAKITAAYGKAKATCEVRVIALPSGAPVVAEDPRINISVHQNKLTIDLRKLGNNNYTVGDDLIAIVDENGESVAFTQNNQYALVDWLGEVGMHEWTFVTNKKLIVSEVCHATHIIARLTDFGPLSDDWDEATLGNASANPYYQNDTKDWYVVLDDNINAGGGEDTSFAATYSFGENYAVDAELNAKGDPTNGYRYAVFNGTFDGRGYSITGLNTQAGFIANLGKTGVIKNLALLDARNGRNFSCGILGIYGFGTVENVFIEGYLKEWGGWSSGMYIRVNASHPLTVKNCLVIARLYYGKWPNANVPCMFGCTLQRNPVNIINSFGISQEITMADGGGTDSDEIVFKDIREWINGGYYVDLDGIWEIGQNNIFFGGQQVYSWEN